jgi:hypothetical protein
MASREDDRAGRGGGGGRTEQERRPSKAWGILIFGLIGATTATFAVAQVRRSVDWVYSQFNKMQTTSWRNASNSSNRGSFSEDARRRYYQRMQQEYEEEQERVVSFK